MAKNYKNYDEDYFDDYYDGRKGQKKPYKPKKKYNGHQNKFGKQNSPFWEDPDTLTKVAPIQSQPASVSPVRRESTMGAVASVPQAQPAKKQFVPGEHSQEIKGSIIDFDRLEDIQKVEQEHNGAITYGIKFLFKGKKGLFRIVWYNRNQRLRDKVFNEKVAYWQEVQGY